MNFQELIKTDRVKKLVLGNVKMDIIVSGTNIHDIFIAFKELNINEIKVDLSTMLFIVRFIGASCSQTNYGTEAIKTGKVDEYLGIKLILEL